MPGTVTIACKMPNGMVLRVHDTISREFPSLGGGTRTETIPIEKARVVVAGPAVPFGMAPKVPMAGGFALTHGVDADFWKAFAAQHKDAPYIRAGLVFALEKPDSVEREAKNRKNLPSGLEPIDTSTKTVNGKEVQKDYRWPKSLHPNVSTPTTDDKKD